MARKSQQSKNGPDNTLRPTPKVIWAILFIFTFLSILGFLVVIIIAMITKNLFLLAPGTTCSTVPAGILGLICRRIIYAHYKLNDREYIIEEIKANRGIKRMRKYGDESKNKPSIP